MDFFNNKNLNRRNFIKGAAGAAVCCACFPLDYSAASEKEEKDKTDNSKGKVHLAAACGTYCGACPAYLAKQSKNGQTNPQKKLSSVPAKASPGIPPSNWMDGLLCDGCLRGGALAAHCQNCAIRKCAANKQKDSRCTDCGELPCYRITNLINMGNYLHRKEYLPNLKKIREMGAREWVKKEEERWKCPKCGQPISWYDAKCPGCAEPRSKAIFPL
jgi:hypothetical protein